MTTIKDNVNKLFLEILQGEELTDKKTILEVLNTYCEKNSIYPTENKERAKTIREALEDIINEDIIISSDGLREVLLDYIQKNIAYNSSWATALASLENASTAQLLHALNTTIGYKSDVSKFEAKSLSEELLEILKRDSFPRLYFDENGYLIKQLTRSTLAAPLNTTYSIMYSPAYPNGIMPENGIFSLNGISYYPCETNAEHIITAYKVINATSDTPMHLEKVQFKIELRLDNSSITIPNNNNKPYITYVQCKPYVIFYEENEPQEAQLLTSSTAGPYVARNISLANDNFGCDGYFRGTPTIWNIADFYYKGAIDQLPLTFNQGDVIAYINTASLGQLLRADFINDPSEEESV